MDHQSEFYPSSRAELKNAAKQALSTHYWPAVLVTLILSFISGSGSVSSGVSNSLSASSSDLGVPVFSFGTGPDLLEELDHIPDPLLAVVIIGAVLFVLFSIAFSLLLGNPLTVSCHAANIGIMRGEDRPLQRLAAGFQQYGRNVLGMFLKNLYLTLWSLPALLPFAIATPFFIQGGNSASIALAVSSAAAVLLLIPMIIKSFSYSLTAYVLAESEHLSGREAIRLSRMLMQGHKWEYFVLHLSFLGWELLGLLTCGLLNLFYVTPYMYLTDAAFYRMLKAEAIRTGRLHPVHANEGDQQP